jgi:sterol 3beta-glucosyltransferase
VRVALLTAGSRGDVQPFVTLARALRLAGHDATVAGPPEGAALAAPYGVPYAAAGADYQALLATDEGRALLGNPLRAARVWRTLVEPTVRATLDGAWAAAQGADVLVVHPKVLGAPDIAERLGARAFVATPVPLLAPTGAFPAPGTTTRDLGPWLNRRSYALVAAAARPFAGLLRRWRAEVLGLAPRPPGAGPYRLGGAPLPVLQAFSAHVVPPPSDWPAWAPVTGFWFDEDVGAPAPAGGAGWSPPRELLAFLAAGEPPVYVGFGSMVGRDPEAATRLVVEAVRRAGVRAVIAAGWGGLSVEVGRAVSDRLHLIDGASHGWLFPRVAAVVHHGGAGTTAAGLRAGRPTVICPFAADQPFWGARVAALGVGPAPLPQRRLTADALAAAIRVAVTDADMRARAERLGTAVREERGVARAVASLTAGEAPGRTG